MRSAASPATRVEIRLVAPRAKIRLQGWDSPLSIPPAPESFGAIAGTSWPSATGVSAGAATRVLCVGPADWLVVSDEGEPGSLLEKVQAAIGGSSLRVADVSQAFAILAISGNRARDLLAKGCGLDLHPRAFGPGACARTRLANVAAIVDCLVDRMGDGVSDAPVFRCYVARSHCDYLVSWLTDAAAEWPAA